jgi:hypothetical protein
VLPKALGFYYPNTNSNGTPLKKYAENTVYCNWDTPIGQSVLHYVRQKTQADFAFIKKFIRSIARTTQNERVYNYSKANVYGLDTLCIFSKKEDQLQSLLRGDVVAFFAELKAVNPHVEIQDLEVLNLEKDMDVRTALTDICTTAIGEKIKVATYFSEVNTEIAAFTVAYFAAKNTDTRQQIETFLGRKPLPMEAENAREKLGLDGVGDRVGDGVFLSVASQYLGLIETGATRQICQRCSADKNG